ncbi:MAG TPA: electron transfer flavoprotein subunit beta/FixA family protein, partial [Anaerolineae bacterium]|nr:electron transfer flavoprotein subunit beta/FixA family protein [Anaerolineae bacterium]HIQ04205.1 electron transfer flavoprotein subunit beta/FixA family protein [Anaerolineae bacterium]
MNIVVPVKLVPDLVEELEIDESGTALDTTWLRLILNEFDDHAIEQAILLKERSGGQVTVVAPDVEDVDDVLYTAAAKGADRLIKLVNDFEAGVNNHALARLLTPVVKDLQPDLVLTGVQAHNDLDGSVGPLLAGYLGMPYVGYVAGVTVRDGKVSVRKEYPGGLSAEMEVTLPAVLGIQAAEEPPRYVAFSRIRQAMKTATIEEQPAAELDLSGGPNVGRMFQPEVGERATMIEGDEEEVATKLVDLFKELGVL